MGMKQIWKHRKCYMIQFNYPYVILLLEEYVCGIRGIPDIFVELLMLRRYNRERQTGMFRGSV